MNKPTRQQVIEAYKKLPPPVREFLADPDKLARVLENIRNAHGLHIDVAGQIGESVGYLLLGLANPNEFKETLKTASVSEATASEIIGEINQKIFVPLREEMRRGASTAPAPAPARPSIQHPPLPRPPTPQRRPAEPERYFHLENKIPPLARPVAPLPPVFNPNIAPLPPKNVLPQGSQGSMGPKLLRDREEPHLEIKKTAPPPPRPAVAPSGVGPPKPSFAPPNLPGAMPPPPPLPPAPPEATQGTAPPTPRPTPPQVPAKPYTTDPYREPIGGK